MGIITCKEYYNPETGALTRKEIFNDSGKLEQREDFNQLGKLTQRIKFAVGCGVEDKITHHCYDAYGKLIFTIPSDENLKKSQANECKYSGSPSILFSQQSTKINLQQTQISPKHSMVVVDLSKSEDMGTIQTLNTI